MRIRGERNASRPVPVRRLGASARRNAGILALHNNEGIRTTLSYDKNAYTESKERLDGY